MREIKFRAWDKRVGKWVEKFMISPHGNIETFCIHSGNDIEIMQFTGLKDKNEKEIYEGDLVRYKPNWVKTDWDPEVVRYENHGFAPFLYDDGGEFDAEDTLVIGNIYENPELVKS